MFTMGSFCGAHWCSWHIEHLVTSDSIYEFKRGQYTALLGFLNAEVSDAEEFLHAAQGVSQFDGP